MVHTTTPQTKPAWTMCIIGNHWSNVSPKVGITSESSNALYTNTVLQQPPFSLGG